MRADVRTDFNWQAQFAPEIKMNLGLYLIQEAPAKDDLKHNTDFMVLELGPVRVACRIRRFDFLSRYPDEFTIRAERPNGHETELAKVLSGWGDYIFYGFADATEDRLAAWFIGDLSVFRLWFQRETAKRGAGELPGLAGRNPDGSSTFRAFRLGNLPGPFVVARKEWRRAA